MKRPPRKETFQNAFQFLFGPIEAQLPQKYLRNTDSFASFPFRSYVHTCVTGIEGSIGTRRTSRLGRCSMVSWQRLVETQALVGGNVGGSSFLWGYRLFLVVLRKDQKANHQFGGGGPNPKNGLTHVWLERIGFLIASRRGWVQILTSGPWFAWEELLTVASCLNIDNSPPHPSNTQIFNRPQKSS